MPLITIVYASQRRSLSLKREIAEAVTALTAQILRKAPKVTAVIVSEADAADWFAGGASLAYAAINPAIALGAFLAQLILSRPVAAANTREFHISGSWDDPKVEKVENPAAARPASAP